ncbi:hypothetical protein DYU05_11855 [Mucilaginibacter terrenus]|uniref:Uncharacterized protein n=1 Tax=Mucilaginibacter terrenus TaxID=2482727 RepID=A0A3E2NPH4_9SPHI|nr:hypothetical protein [Mucilaginibacter terrenus]RFZ82851.1 hypothetical protein DYU05_11855 [Mucilaginibacter terrenus]
MKLNLKTTPVINLNDFDPADIQGVLHQIEASFDIKFEDSELKNISTFNSLCELVTSKVKQAHTGCTTQQAFYKLRNAINAKNPTEKYLIKPQTKLCELFPRDNRIEVVADIENDLGFHMNLLQPKPWITWSFALLLVASLGLFFISSTIAFIGMVISIAGLRLAGRFGKELKVKTIGDLAEKIAREHHLKCRRDASTVSRTEISQKVKDLFTAHLHLEPVFLMNK